MSAPEDSTRPISVAELLARNGTIGSPPVGGHRRRRRRNADGVSVAELTGEIPVVRTGEIPVTRDETPAIETAASAESGEMGEDSQPATVADSAATVVVYASGEGAVADTVVYGATDTATDTVDVPSVDVPSVDVPAEPEPVRAPLPRSAAPLPTKRRGPERAHDPRPLRRSSGAEQMAYDPVDESVDLADLVEEQAGEAEELRSYLQSSDGTLFSGGTVADDIARGGATLESAGLDSDAVPSPPVARRGLRASLWNGAVAVLQSLLAVVFGAGLFIAFDQLWRWNNLVALVLSVLVVLTLAAGVRVVRKTEDIASTLIAVAVGLLVTLGPLALQST